MRNRVIPPALADAQRSYMAITGVQISQTEVQRLSSALHGGASIADAVRAVHAFFAEPIDWEVERALFAARLAKLSRGACRVNLIIGCVACGNVRPATAA